MTERVCKSAEETSLEDIRQNYSAIKQDIAEAMDKVGRTDEVRIMAVTKTVPCEKINFAESLGIDLLGENRVQEFLGKYEKYSEKSEIHFIGGLQKNKVKYIIDKVSMIHSVDSVDLAAEIDRRAGQHGKMMDILLEVNIGGELSKGGVSPQELIETAKAVSELRNINIRGLMTIPPAGGNEKYFAQMVDAGCDSVVMEVSSQGLMLHRTAGIPFEIGIFTNLGEDHIGPNEHKDFEDYKRCKGLLFKQCKIGIANVDDQWFEDVFQGATCEIETFGFSEKADLRATDVEHISRPGYLGVNYHVSGLMDFDVEIDIPGEFSVYNSLTAIAVCRHFDVPVENIKAALKVARVKGRIEMIKVSDDFTLMIDYAHNAMALESLLHTLRDYNPGRIVAVFGCGGNRSKTRRYEMGEVAGKMADFTIITSDNPRYEEPQAIIDDIIMLFIKCSFSISSLFIWSNFLNTYGNIT